MDKGVPQADGLSQVEPVPVSPLRASIPDADYFDDDEADFDEEFEFDCHMGPDGYCGAAGSEDCEFECPYRRGGL